MASATPVGSQTTTMGAGGPMSGGNLSYGDTQFHMDNPGMMNPNQLNPYASQYLGNVNQLQSEFQNSAAGGAFNPHFYDQMKNTQEAQITNSLGNQYARMGLSGSSAEMGGMANSIQNNQMQWLNRQQGDQMKAMQGMEGLDNLGYRMTTGIQGQYGDFESAYNQSLANLLGLSQQKQAQDNGAIGGMVGSLLGAGGMALGGAFRGSGT